MNSAVKREILSSYIPIIKFFAQQMPDTEIVLHDLTDIKHSIIAIENAHITGRAVGGPATDEALRILRDRSYRDADYTLPYRNSSSAGRFLTSGTYFIKHEGQLIGLLCMNTDITPMHTLKRAAEDTFDVRKPPQNPVPREGMAIDEIPGTSVRDIPVETTLLVIRERNLHPDHLVQEERSIIIEELERRGVFLLKGAVTGVARILHISEPTLYRNLRRIRRQNG